MPTHSYPAAPGALSASSVVPPPESVSPTGSAWPGTVPASASTATGTGLATPPTPFDWAAVEGDLDDRPAPSAHEASPESASDGDDGSDTPGDDELSDENDDGAGTDGKALVAGGSVLALAMFAANGGNYLLNVFLGRWLSPPDFADANLMVTLMLLVTAIAVSLQLIAARFAGIHAVSGTEDDTRAMAQSLQRWAMIGGIAFGVLLGAGAPMWADIFNVASPLPFIVLGLGMPCYLIQAVGRGVLQGQLEFRKLAGTFVKEMIVRVVLGIGLVAIGFGVVGATAALTASFVATWLAVKLALGWKGKIERVKVSREVLAYAGPVGVLLLGQIIINNGDVLISKGGLEPTQAGVYAAVALVGRAVFFLSWSVATTIFPAAAQREEAGEESNGLLYAGLGAVAVLGVVAVVGARLLGGTVLGRVFGEEYGDVSVQLSLYALATAIFAMANLIVSHYLALGHLREAVIMLVGGGVQTGLLLVTERSIDGLIHAQVVAMFLLFAAVFASHGAREMRPKPIAQGASLA
ncbi:MAG: oligosaccharide flippase family protein [Actinomycetota bacterium]